MVLNSPRHGLKHRRSLIFPVKMPLQISAMGHINAKKARDCRQGGDPPPLISTQLETSKQTMVNEGIRDRSGKISAELSDSPDRIYPSLANQALVLTGPTASGKSEIAVHWARSIGGEILSLDSIAVYCGMDIGTAKPAAVETDQVRHHLIDVVQPDEDFSVACYLEMAHQKVAEVRSRGRTPIFVGGTPMYLKAILRGFDPGPPADWELRGAIEADLASHGIDALRERLWQVDPLSAHRIDPNDSRRMIRALEVAQLTGQPMSHRQVQFEHCVAPDQCAVFSLRWDRAELHRRIERRVDRMFDAGLVSEVSELLKRYGRLSRTASQAVGYREVIDHLGGAMSLEECQQQVIFHTRRLARRQETWFRSFDEIKPVEMSTKADAKTVADQLMVQSRSP